MHLIKCALLCVCPSHVVAIDNTARHRGKKKNGKPNVTVNSPVSQDSRSLKVCANILHRISSANV